MSERKILIVTNRVPYPLKDGGNLAMHAMIEGYHKAGWKVLLLSMNTSRHRVSEDQLRKIYTHIHGFEWVDINNDVNWKKALINYLFSRQPEHAERFYHQSFRDKLADVLYGFNPDVVQVESVFLTTYLPDIRQHSSAITVLRMHNVEYQIWQGLARRTPNQLKKLYFGSLSVRIRNFERAAWKEYDMVLPITEKDAYQVSRLEEISNLEVAPYGLDLSKIQPGANERWVGYHIGAMDWLPNRKAMEWFLNHAWPKVHKAVPRFEFYFAGREMPEEFSKLRLSGVHCMNEVPDAAEFIADKKILIVPLWSGGGIRVKILEAMAAGKVVVTTSTGIKGIEASPGVHYLRIQTPRDAANAIKWCLTHPEDAQKMADAARQLIAEKYERNKVMNTITASLEKLLEHH